MKNYSRRNFLKTTALSAAAITAAPYLNWAEVFAKSKASEIQFRPYPHAWMPKIEQAYLTDEQGEPFKSDIKINQDGIIIPRDITKEKVGLNLKWFIEGFGYLWLCADNGGDNYSMVDLSSKELNLNHEFAKSRVFRNRQVKSKYEKIGTIFSPEVKHLSDLSEELFEDASKRLSDGTKAAGLADKALLYALHAGEKIELEHAQNQIFKMNRKDKVHFGCESRQLVWAKSEEFTKRFPEVFDYATITHYVWDSWYQLFEPTEGAYNWGIKDDIVKFLDSKNITMEGRPLFWFHPVVTPDWLKNKNYDQLKTYIDKHTKDLVTHYGDKVLEWEVVNEYHDWANIFNHTVEQTTEVTRQICNRTKEVNPKVVKIINNCCLWGEYAGRGRMAGMPATRHVRTAYQYMKDITDAGIDYDVVGIQIYFPQRDLSDIVRMVEKFERFNKPIYITEIGASAGLSSQALATGDMKLNSNPYDWHRPWDEELQADWLEQVYTIYYSKPLIKTINWYDFSDFRPFIVNGGLVREDCSPKMSFNRLKDLLTSWNRLPKI